MPKLTHRGWFFMCPVYIAEPQSEAPFLTPRRFIPEWWFAFNEVLYGVFAMVAEAMYPNREVLYAIVITGELAKPIDFQPPQPDKESP